MLQADVAQSEEAAEALEEARVLYERAVRLRELYFGPAHPETIACMHNLAELARVADDEPAAVKIQQEILHRLGHE